MSILKNPNKVVFDPTNQAHMRAYADYLQNENNGEKSPAWKNGCPFEVEHPYLDVITCMNAKIAEQVIRNLW